MEIERAKEKKAGAQFKPGQSGNPTGKKQVNTKSCSPASGRDTKAMHANSTVGKVAV